MIRHSIAVRTTGVANASPGLEIIAPTDKCALIRSISVSLAAATASSYGLGRPAAKGVGPTTPAAVLRESGPFTGLTTVALAWGTTAPTAPTSFYRRAGFPATVGTLVTWVFDSGLAIPAGATLVLWNLQLNGVVDVSITLDE